MFHVKHPNTHGSVDADSVRAALSAVGVSATKQQAELIARHAALVAEANTRMNLTRITDPDDVLALHVVDSLAFVEHCEALSGRIIDIGSGAGYPGVLLSILGHDVWLCESVKKKAAFLAECVADLGLNATVQPLRAEELALAAPRSADVVIARAVSALASLIELASPLLKNGGRLVALKGSPQEQELAMAAKVAPMCGMVQTAACSYSLPSGEERTLVVYERSGFASVTLPRRPGMAQRQPLGEP